MYLEYLDWLKRVYPPDDPNFKLIYEGALPDTLVWRNRLGYAEMMTENYLRHPGYGEYPVVGVSWTQAVEFADWRTDRVNELYLEDAGYLKRDARITDVSADANFNTDTYINAPTETFGGNDEILNGGKRRTQTNAAGEEINVYAKRESGIITPEYRLPSEAEWEYAALGLSELRSYNTIRGRKKYPWSGSYTRSGKRKTKGDQLANFKQGKGDYGGIAGWSDDGADITAEVKSYEPNDFNLYNMAGNVSEWVQGSYDPGSYEYMSTINPTVNDASNSRKVVRGGSWKDVAYFLQVSSRDYEYSDSARSYIGFRTVQDYMGTDVTSNAGVNKN
jgi:gliding motility-associated lipoprotein GldJ